MASIYQNVSVMFINEKYRFGLQTLLLDKQWKTEFLSDLKKVLRAIRGRFGQSDVPTQKNNFQGMLLQEFRQFYRW